MLTKSDLKMLEDICNQSSVGVWRDFPAKGRGYRTHIGYTMLREGDGEMVNVPIFETNTNAKRGDVLFVVYAHEYMLKLIEDVKALRAVLSGIHEQAKYSLDHGLEPAHTAMWQIEADSRVAIRADLLAEIAAEQAVEAELLSSQNQSGNADGPQSA